MIVLVIANAFLAGMWVSTGFTYLAHSEHVFAAWSFVLAGFSATVTALVAGTI